MLNRPVPNHKTIRCTGRRGRDRYRRCRRTRRTRCPRRARHRYGIRCCTSGARAGEEIPAIVSIGNIELVGYVVGQGREAPANPRPFLDPLRGIANEAGARRLGNRVRLGLLKCVVDDEGVPVWRGGSVPNFRGHQVAWLGGWNAYPSLGEWVPFDPG